MDSERTPRGLVADALWDQRAARTLRRWGRQDALWGILAAVEAVIAHHDLTRPDAPRTGQPRVLSIVEHTRQLCADVKAHPEKYGAAQAMASRAAGGIDLQLLVIADRVLAELPRLSTYRESEDPDA